MVLLDLEKLVIIVNFQALLTESNDTRHNKNKLFGPTGTTTSFDSRTATLQLRGLTEGTVTTSPSRSMSTIRVRSTASNSSCTVEMGKISPESCLKGQWGTQVKIPRILLQSRFRTRKKEDADLFFVPAYARCVCMMGGLNDKEINQTYVKADTCQILPPSQNVVPFYFDVLSQMPYFRLSGGRNHIFVFPSGAGAHLFKSWATYLNRSIILTPEGDRTDKRDTSAFNTWKDIIIPGNVDDGMTTDRTRVVDPLPLSKRKYLANFLGGAQGKLGRLQLIELAKQFPNKLESPELKLSGPDKLGRKDYFEHLRNAKFCLAPRGESSWTLRFYESFFVECVPVILSDQAEFPFQNVLTTLNSQSSGHLLEQVLNFWSIWNQYQIRL